MFMLQLRAHVCLTQEPAARRNIMHQVRTNNLDSDRATKSGALMCEIHLTHPTSVNRPYQVIVPKTRPALIFHYWAVLLSHSSTYFQLVDIRSDAAIYTRRTAHQLSQSRSVLLTNQRRHTKR